MTTKAEELARSQINHLGSAMTVWDLQLLLEQYGRLVQEAAAKEAASRFSSNGQGQMADFIAGDLIAKAIREMPLP